MPRPGFTCRLTSRYGNSDVDRPGCELRIHGLQDSSTIPKVGPHNDLGTRPKYREMFLLGDMTGVMLPYYVVGAACPQRMPYPSGRCHCCSRENISWTCQYVGMSLVPGHSS